jgi:hypothetical protein
MKTAQDIVDAVGRDAIRIRFGVKDRVIRSHVAEGQLPASWFAAMCEMTGQDLPRSLFTFKGVAA